MSDLSPKQQRFVEEFLIDLNATQAAIRAGYSEKTAAAIGCENLTKPEIAAAIAASQAARSARTEITADTVLREFGKIGRSDVRKLFTELGALKAIHHLDDDTAAAIASIEVVTRRIPGADDAPAEVEYVHKIRTCDKVAALTQLGRHLGMFLDRTEVSSRVTLEELVLQASAIHEHEVAQVHLTHPGAASPAGTDNQVGAHLMAALRQRASPEQQPHAAASDQEYQP